MTKKYWRDDMKKRLGTYSTAENRARSIWDRSERGEIVPEEEITEDVLVYLNEWCSADIGTLACGSCDYYEEY